MINNDFFKINLIVVATLIICVIFSKIEVASIVSLVAFGIFLIAVMRLYISFYIKYFYITFMVMATVFACGFIEFGDFFLLEVREFSKYTGAIPLLVLSYVILITTVIYFDKKYENKIKLTKFRIGETSELFAYKYISIFTLMIIIICFVKVLPHPSFLVHLERADYAIQYGLTGFLGKIAQDIPRLIIFPFILAVSCKGTNKYIGLSCLVLAVLYFLWIGNKFGAFFEMMCIFLLVLSDYIVGKFSNTKIFTLIKRIAIVFIVLICLTLFVQSITYNGIMYTYFTSRIAAEGQIWWRVFDLSAGNFHIEELFDELQVFELGTLDVRESINSHYGIYKMMYFIAPESYVTSLLAAGYRYTEAGFAVMFYYFSYVGPVIYAFLMGGYFSLITNKLTLAINKRQFLRVYLYMRLWLYGTTSFSMFIFSPFFTPMSIAIYIYLIATHNKSLYVNFGKGRIRL